MNNFTRYMLNYDDYLGIQLEARVKNPTPPLPHTHATSSTAAALAAANEGRHDMQEVVVVKCKLVRSCGFRSSIEAFVSSRLIARHDRHERSCFAQYMYPIIVQPGHSNNCAAETVPLADKVCVKG